MLTTHAYSRTDGAADFRRPVERAVFLLGFRVQPVVFVHDALMVEQIVFGHGVTPDALELLVALRHDQLRGPLHAAVHHLLLDLGFLAGGIQ